MGGPCEGSEGDDEPDDDDDDDQPDEESAAVADSPDAQVPIAYHMLPSTVLTDLVDAWSVRHVLDFTPSPGDAMVKLVESGVSYFGLCASDKMRDYLMAKAEAAIAASIKTPGSLLFDRRLAGSVGEGADLAGGTTPPSGNAMQTPPGKLPVGVSKNAPPVPPPKAKPSPGTASSGSKAGTPPQKTEKGADLNALLSAARAHMMGGSTGNAEEQ